MRDEHSFVQMLRLQAAWVVGERDGPIMTSEVKKQ